MKFMASGVALSAAIITSPSFSRSSSSTMMTILPFLMSSRASSTLAIAILHYLFSTLTACFLSYAHCSLLTATGCHLLRCLICPLCSHMYKENRDRSRFLAQPSGIFQRNGREYQSRCLLYRLGP